MFNEQMKKEFIEFKTNRATINKYFLPNLFSRTEPYEKELNKDVSCFTAPEIENMYRTINYVSPATLEVTNSNLSQYANWCITEKHITVDSQNHFLEFNRDRISGLVDRGIAEKKILSRKEVEDLASGMDNPSDRALLLGLYEGIKGDNFNQLWSLKDSDVDAVNNKINVLRSNQYKRLLAYSHELCQYAKESAESSVYYLTDKNGKEREMKMQPSDMVFKEQPNAGDGASDFRKGRRIYTKLIKILKGNGLGYLNANDIYNSGLLDFINRGSEKYEVSRKDYVRQHMDEITTYYDRKIQASALFHGYPDFFKD